MGDHGRTPQKDCYDISRKTKLFKARFGGTFGTLDLMKSPILSLQ